MKALVGFFNGIQIPKCIGATYLTLIPKGQNVAGIGDLRPISLCNFLHKIIARIINSRLAVVLPKLVSLEQSGFIKNRRIHESIALAHDLISVLNSDIRGGNILMKIDMSKAYDRLSWPFILAALRANGFHEKTVDIIFRCFSSPWFSIKWNGKIYGNFKSTCGLRQGDPLSPTLFVIAMEWLSKALNVAVQEGSIGNYHTGFRMPYINHLLFADDVLIFSNGCIDSVTNLMSLIKEFCLLSGQKLNDSKSFIFFSDSINDVRQEVLLNTTGFSKGEFPTSYLGVPLYTGITKIIYFQYLEEKFKNRICGWMKNFLSMGGKLTLIESVLNSVGVHSMSVLPIPKTIISRLHSLMSSFLWNQGDEKRRHWVGWDKAVRPLDAGGLGLKSLDDMMLSFQGKLAWAFINSDSLWAKFARRKFRPGVKGSRIWNTIDHLVSHLQEHSRWIIGDGAISTDEFFLKLNMQTPGGISGMAIKDVIGDQSLHDCFLSAIPPSLSLKYDQIQITSGTDRFVWEGCSSGLFSAKAFRSTFGTKWPSLSWGNLIWKPWIPRKISVFMWKFFHNGIPTQARIQGVGIYLASKCFCCVNPDIENLHHLFFLSDMAKDMWIVAERTLGIARPNGRATLIHNFFRCDAHDTQNAFRIALICCTLWEIWKWRNKVCFDGRAPKNQGTMQRWYRDLCPLIKGKGSDNLRTIRFSLGDSNGEGLVTAALIKRQNCIYGAAIFKPQGNCKWSIFCSRVPLLDGLGEIIYFLSKVIAMGRLHGIPTVKICSSNPFISWLENPEKDVPWNELGRVRSFRLKFKGISFIKTCPVNNNGALALAEASAQSLRPVLQVPWVKLAIAAERRNLVITCTVDHCTHDEVFVALDPQGRDDLLVGRRPPRMPD